MHQYLQVTTFATKNLFILATCEEHELNKLLDKLRQVEEQFRVHQWDFETSDLNDDFPDTYVMAAYARAARSREEAERLKPEVAVLQASVGAHQHAVQAIAGAILQIAKQGISFVHGRLGAAPAGRKLGSLDVRDVIWEARNQSMHYEEGFPPKRTRVRDVFATLEHEQGPQFSLPNHLRQSRAKQVLEVLGWNNYESYLRDMRVLLP